MAKSRAIHSFVVCEMPLEQQQQDTLYQVILQTKTKQLILIWSSC